MAEEIQDAAYTLPRVIVGATALNGALIWIMCITICYTFGDLEAGMCIASIPYAAPAGLLTLLSVDYQDRVPFHPGLL